MNHGRRRGGLRGYKLDSESVEQQLSKKSLWRSATTPIWEFICPLCKTNRKVPFRSRPGGFRHYFQVGLCAVVFMFATWGWWKWKGIVAFIPFWTIFEVVYRSRMRTALRCPYCGFDPYLFLVDEQWARREVESHWRKKYEERGIPYPEPAPARMPTRLDPNQFDQNKEAKTPLTQMERGLRASEGSISSLVDSEMKGPESQRPQKDV